MLMVFVGGMCGSVEEKAFTANMELRTAKSGVCDAATRQRRDLGQLSETATPAGREGKP